MTIEDYAAAFASLSLWQFPAATAAVAWREQGWFS